MYIVCIYLIFYEMNYFSKQWWKKRNIVIIVCWVLFAGLVIWIANYTWSSKLFLTIKSFVGPDPEGYISIIIIAMFIGLIIWYTKKTYTINKLKSWQIPTREITAQVTAIEYVKWGKYDNSAIAGRTFTAEGMNPISNEPYTFSSEEYPYINTKSRLRLFWPTKEDKEEFNTYVAQYIKIGDPIKVFVSIESADDYYLQELPQSAYNILEDWDEEIADSNVVSSSMWSFRDILKVVWLSFFLFIVLCLFILIYIWKYVSNVSVYWTDVSPEMSGWLLLLIVWIIWIIWIIRWIVAVVRSNKKKHVDPGITHGA